tara:strand:+ start:927 stop:1943 length:1017 start_codon:yes stop_codon:yes gene_type:complete
MSKVKQLKNLVLGEISLVDRPANPEAHVSFYKRFVDKVKGVSETENSKDDKMKVNELAKAKLEEFRKGIASSIDELDTYSRNYLIMEVANMLGQPIEEIIKAKEADEADEAEETEKNADESEESKEEDDKEEELAEKSDGEEEGEEAQETEAETEKSDPEETAKSEDEDEAKADEEEEKTELTKAEISLTKRAEEAEATIAAMKADVEKTDAENATLKADKAEAAFRKRALSEIPNLSGKSDDLVSLLKAVDAMGDIEGEKALDVLKTASKAIGDSVLKEEGTSQEAEELDAKDELTKLAKSHSEKHGVTYADAYATVMKTKHGVELYNTMKQNKGAK